MPMLKVVRSVGTKRRSAMPTQKRAKSRAAPTAKRKVETMKEVKRRTGMRARPAWVSRNACSESG